MGLPFLEVAHLASSSSFYSSVIQPLGLSYLSTDDGPFPSIVYGDRRARSPLFELRQIRASRDRPLKPSHIVLSAPSADAADDAYESALRATPESQERSRHHPRDPFQQDCSVTRDITPGGKTQVHIIDFDGNSMEIVYRPPPEYDPYYGGPTVRRTQSTPKEASRIMDWSYGIAITEMPSGPKSGASSRTAGRRPYSGHPSEEPYSSLKRSITDGTLVHEPLPSPRQNSTGFSTGTVVGTLLGVAAGAALGGVITYSKVKADRSRQPRQEFDAPGISRRSTFPAPDPYADRKSRYVDVERTVEKGRYPDDYAPVADYRPAPDYIARYSQAGVPRSREVEDVDYEERRSRHSASRSRASTRHRSEGPSNRSPLLLEEMEHRSQASSSRTSRHPPIVQRSYTYDAPERDSFVSARSHRSSTTARGPPQPGQSVPLSSRSRSGSRITTTTVKVGGSPDGRAGTYVSARGVPLPPSTYVGARGVPLPPSTYVQAREVPLPRSKAGRSRSGWDDEDDNDSVAPSDSISCVGSRRSGRAYH
ncbi:hypothetical protein QBC34DRAFT_40528 [Podospora aff. communis PSN243]|uniref:Uncharacterized protein n=1 Tax=Podospora aff. communis PSN243 TaxID=3040156 RepID=A0AAV9GUZ1_9PEZI|nr:hypothetical protein QBC34DRAFT_40528 [Podospora aff. communis PSN243]